MASRMPSSDYFDPHHREASNRAKDLKAGYNGAFYDRAGNDSSCAIEDSASTESEQESSLASRSRDVHSDLPQVTKGGRLAQRAATVPHIRSRPFDPPFQANAIKRHHSMALPIARNVVSFLELYDSFAGEDLAETEDESSDDEQAIGETRPLLGRRKSSKRYADLGDASNMKTFFILLKAFIGTGIMFLPKAFRNGGILFSSITLITISLVTCVCFHMLLKCRKQYGGSYGDIGEAIGGKRFRSLILISIAVSQIGFVCAGIIFTAENLFSFCSAVSSTYPGPLSINQLILLQLVVLIPLAYIRNISKLGPAALLADAFILLGLAYIYWFDISSMISRHGLHPTVQLFNPKDFTLTIGSAIFTFEGIGLILPIQSSMKSPEKFPFLLYTVMFIITVVFTAVGALSYGTFGTETSTEIISNFPQDSKLVNTVQFLYSLAVLVGTPVQLFPAVRIMEGKLFGPKSGGQDRTVKWKKNGFRTAIVLLSTLIAAVGAGDLDKFVSLIGAFACVPLVYIYPPYLHFKGVASSRAWMVFDVVMMILGVVCMVYTTCITIKIWAADQ